MRKILLAFVLLGAVPALPVHAASAIPPALAALAVPDQATVQTVQYYGNDRRDYLRRQEFRRRQEIRRERFRRREAARRGYYRRY